MSRIFIRLWPVAILCVAIVLSLPLLVISGSLWLPALEVWAHLASTVLSDYVINSLIVMVGVGIGTFILGVGPAWLTAMCC
ncbi:MAG TPA: iron ABC transporter permease, partial [Gammaproteobacteria bacterium]|nr:iron ABC transporter permease [Gammaproteobacteria bacterium]